MVFQTILQTASLAKESIPDQENEMVKVGEINTEDIMPLNAKTMQAINRLTKSMQKAQPINKGTQLFSKPWFPNQRDPEDKDKPLYFGKVYVNLKTKGLTQQDGTELPFDWEGVFGKDEYGEINKVKIIFVQLNYNEGSFSTETGIKGILETDTEGKHYWADENGDPIKLPLYSKDLKPYKYEVYIERSNSERVNLILDGSFGTPDFTFAKPDPKTGEIVADVFMDNTLIQLASTKFVSEWNTDTIENDRPVVEFSYNTHNVGSNGEEIEGYFEFPKNNIDIEIIRDDNREDGKYSSILLEKVPTVDVADPDPESNDTYTLDRDNNRISYKERTYNYTFNYDVINGGKLTMTEVLILKFDANGGKFDSVQPGEEQVKEHEVIYTKDLTDSIEEPKSDYETFLGWGIKDESNNFVKDKRGNILLVDESAFKNIKKSQIYYAVWDKHPISADFLEVKESFKDGTGYVNDFIPKLETLKGQVKIKDASGTPQALTDYDTLQILDDDGNAIADADLKDKLYEKLKEDDATEVSRKVTLKAKVTHKNGTSQEVDIPIKVIKNIYEAKTLTEKPIYVPENYVKVTVDPTTKAQDPQKTYFYVNPAAKVVIPGENPTGKDDNLFLKWTMKADNATGEGTEYKLTDKPRTQFTEATTITAQYSSDVIPQTGDDKPQGVPDNFVKVTFVPTDKGTMDGAKIFWVNPAKEVTIPVNNPVGITYYTFNEWKIGDVKTGETYTVGTPKQFTDKNGTTITATYTESKNIIEYDPKNPETKPAGYITVSFEADLGLKLKGVKYYFVKKNAIDTDGNPLTLGSTALKKPEYDTANGYKFDKWEPADTTTIGTEDIVVTAKAKQDSSPDKPDKPGDGPGYGPSYPEVIYRDRVVEKEKIVEKIVHVDDGMNKEIRYMQGFDGFFRPYDGLSRAEAAQILANALREDGYVYNPNFVLPYSDVGDMWYTEAVKVVTEAGVFKGDGNGLFKPTDKITRVEWIATLRRFQNLQEANGNTMNLKAGHWATNEVQAAYEAGWLDIYQNGIAKFVSDEPITRQEVAAVSNKAFRRVLDKIYIDRNYKGLINYKDIDSSMALYEDILCASNTFLHDGRRYRAHGVLYKEIKFDHKTIFNIDTDDLKIIQDKFQYILR